MIISQSIRKYDKVKIVVLASWFLSLVGVRLLFGFVLSNSWVGTIGAVAITFAIFYVALRFTPLRKYRFAVNNVIRQWYKKKLFMYSLFGTAAILLAIISVVEYGYFYHSEKIFSIEELNTVSTAQQELKQSVEKLDMNNYSYFDVLSIVIASVDKSLGGYYLKAVSSVFAENLEVMAFMVIMKRTENIF